MNKALSNPADGRIEIDGYIKSIKNILKRNQFHFKKSLGQNFLISSHYLNRIYSILPSGKNVIEIGTGLGSLTKLLLLKNCNVITYEVDPRIYKMLAGLIGKNNNVRVINGNIISEIDKFDNSNNYEVISALPYTSYRKILLKLFAITPQFNKYYLILQEEVFRKLTATKGKSVRPLSVIINYLFEIDKHFAIPNSAFIPAPRVSSIFFELTRINQLQNTSEVYSKLIELFRSRRKINKSAGARVEEIPIAELINMAKN